MFAQTFFITPWCGARRYKYLFLYEYCTFSYRLCETRFTTVNHTLPTEIESLRNCSQGR